MDAATNPPTSSAPENAAPEPSSLVDRLTGVITDPGDVFEEVRNRRVAHSNWLVPLFLCCLGGIFYCIMAFSQPTVAQALQDQREKAIQKQVADHKMTQAQADQANAMVEKFMSPTILKIFGGGGAVVASSSGLFLMALAIWLGLKFFTESKPDYMKMVEVCGLALIIDIPQKIVRTWLVTWKGNMLVTLSPTLFVDHPDMLNRKHVLLTLIDPIDLWWLLVLSLGVSKVAGVRYRTAALIVFPIWIIFGALRVVTVKPQ